MPMKAGLGSSTIMPHCQRLSRAVPSQEREEGEGGKGGERGGGALSFGGCAKSSEIPGSMTVEGHSRGACEREVVLQTR